MSKAITIIFLLLWATIAIMTIFHFAKPSEASARTYSNRTITTCWNNFYGQGWQSSVKYEKKCRGLWDRWTAGEIMGW